MLYPIKKNSKKLNRKIRKISIFYEYLVRIESNLSDGSPIGDVNDSLWKQDGEKYLNQKKIIFRQHWSTLKKFINKK